MVKLRTGGAPLGFTNEIVVIPKSVKQHRIRENADIFDFELSAEDMKKIDDLNRNHRFLPDPDNINF